MGDKHAESAMSPCRAQSSYLSLSTPKRGRKVLYQWTFVGSSRVPSDLLYVLYRSGEHVFCAFRPMTLIINFASAEVLSLPVMLYHRVVVPHLLSLCILAWIRRTRLMAGGSHIPDPRCSLPRPDGTQYTARTLFWTVFL